MAYTYLEYKHMTDDEHTPFRGNIPSYALGALDAEDAAALESHLKTCASCQTELAEYRAVSESLLTAIPPQPPSAALRKHLQSRLPGTQKATRPHLALSFRQLAFGTVLVFLLSLNLLSLAQIRTLQRQQTQLLNQMQMDQTTLAMLAYPDTQTLPISGDGVTGALLLNEDRDAAILIAWDLPSLAEDQIYQIWLIEPNGHRISAGLFHPKEDQAYTTQLVSSKQGFSRFTGIGVTVEPAGGSDQPTGTRIFKIDF
jgi:anti-sigma-K factor RskA